MPRKGFTLIEILIVIGIIAILSSIVIIAVNPARQFAQARDTKRQSDVNAILNAVYQYAVGNNGSMPSTITAIATEVCKDASCATQIDLHTYLVGTAQTYLVSIPVDPSCPTGCTANGAGYDIMRNANGRITVSAPGAEVATSISVTR
jgi:type IV pilus assembly protein PilA